MYQQLDNISKFWHDVSAVKSHRQAKIEQSLGTMKVCAPVDCNCLLYMNTKS
jgi:hypothetical protein